MKVAIFHHWLIGMRGGEKVLEAFCRLYPGADLFTHVADRSKLSDIINSHKITETFVARLPFARKKYQNYLPLMPMALENLDMSGYDLIISIESGPSKGIIPPPESLHICYCNSPMRYIWDQRHVYTKGSGWLKRAIMLPIAHWLRIWDTSSAMRVDHFVSNSKYIRRRVDKYYRRDSSVLYPPVAIEEFSAVDIVDSEGFYLWAGELAPYKRPDIAIDAFNKSGRKLVVIGEGSERKKLERVAKPNISFLGRAPFEVLKQHYASCQALVFPGEEDFGIVPVEAQAAGRPVIAFGKGGALETVVEGQTGLFFYQLSPEALNEAIDRFEESSLGKNCRDACRENAEKFSEQAFRSKFLKIVEVELKKKSLAMEAP